MYEYTLKNAAVGDCVWFHVVYTILELYYGPFKKQMRYFYLWLSTSSKKKKGKKFKRIQKAAKLFEASRVATLTTQPR